VKHLLNVPSFGFNDGPQSRSPLVNGTVDQSLVQFTPAMPDLLLQVIQAGDAVPVNHLLQRTPHSVVHRVETRAVGWPQCWFDEVWNIVLQKFDRQLSAMRRRPILLEDVRLGCLASDVWQQAVLQQNVSIGRTTNKPLFLYQQNVCQFFQTSIQPQTP